MLFSIERRAIEKAILQRNGYRLLSGIMLIVIILQIGIIFYMLEQKKIIIVPPVIEKSFWVSHLSVSPEYLSEMSLFFSNLRLNITPDNAEIQRNILLRYIDPQYYEKFKSILINETDHMILQHTSMSFSPINIKVDTQRLQSIVEGDCILYVGNISLPSKRVRYKINYRYQSGRLFVVYFDEVPHE